MIHDSALNAVLVNTGGYYALPISLVLFGDAVWWRRNHPQVARNLWLAPLLAPPLIIFALGAWWSADASGKPSWHSWSLIGVAAVDAVLAAAIYRRRHRWWPGVGVLLGFSIVWTLYALFMASLALSGDAM